LPAAAAEGSFCALLHQQAFLYHSLLSLINTMADVSDPEIAAAYQEVRKDSSENNWFVLGYSGNAAVQVVAKGSGGLPGLVEQLQDDQCQYAYLRVTSGDEESKRTKFVFISWCGEGVGALKRAKMSVHKASVKTVVRDFAVEIHATSKDELSEGEVMVKVKKAGGADYSGNSSTN